MEYQFKPGWELLWAVVGAVGVAVATSVYAQGFDQVTDWETLVAMLAAAGARSVGVAISAAAGAIIAAVGRSPS